jgi:anti-sigma factor RsiW
VACEEWRDKLDLYVDGELPSADAASLGAHLRTCGVCASDVLERVQLKRSVQIAGKRYQPSAQFRNSVLKTISVKPRRSFDWRFAAVTVLVVLIAAAALTSFFERAQEARLHVYSELADLHVSTLASTTPVDVVSSDRHTVKPWFQGKIPFTFNLPELQGSDFVLVGGRVAYLEQSAGAHLIFQVRQHKISVFIFPERGTEMLRLPYGQTNQVSFNMESWVQNGLRYFVVGDANQNDIGALRKLLQAAS